MTGEREADDRDERAEDAVAPFARDDVEDVFAGGRVDPALVEASVDALFERFEEDTPEEVMLADRRPSEADVVPSPPAFEGFAADVDEALSADGADSVPDPDDVVGFEDAPEPNAPASDGVAAAGSPAGDRSWAVDEPAVPEWSPASEPVASADGDRLTAHESTVADSDGREASARDGASFEWVSEPVVSETVLADPASARRFVSEDGSEEGAAGVLSRLRSTFPF